MVARVWHGVVPVEKADDYGRYLAEGERGVRDYLATPGNLGAYLLQRQEADRVHFLLISLWQSRQAIAAYAGPEIDRARYFPYDLECLVQPEASVAHYEVMVASTGGAG